LNNEIKKRDNTIEKISQERNNEIKRINKEKDIIIGNLNDQLDEIKSSKIYKLLTKLHKTREKMGLI